MVAFNMPHARGLHQWQGSHFPAVHSNCTPQSDILHSVISGNIYATSDFMHILQKQQNKQKA